MSDNILNSKLIRALLLKDTTKKTKGNNLRLGSSGPPQTNNPQGEHIGKMGSLGPASDDGLPGQELEVHRPEQLSQDARTT